ncbi:FtsH-binding integral membrane protein [Rhodobium orientis]|uniref:hypothetical protein n=1 Tax=Rhodobium orientis TaxID=34017 RepID=UPI0016163760|nr:hypothetical protein [Rhodobium orientis]MBB4305139.1 FtsH-binding integral membrane protein [Rhodobium orientis]
MRQHTYLTLALALAVNAVLVGIAVVLLHSVPALEAFAAYLLPIGIIVAIAATPPLAWRIAPYLQSDRDEDDHHRSSDHMHAHRGAR